MLNEVFPALCRRTERRRRGCPGVPLGTREYFDLPFMTSLDNGTGVREPPSSPDAVLGWPAGRATVLHRVRERQRDRPRLRKKSHLDDGQADDTAPSSALRRQSLRRRARDVLRSSPSGTAGQRRCSLSHQSEARRDSIARVIAAREHSDKYKFAARRADARGNRVVFLRLRAVRSRTSRTAKRSPGADGDVTGDNRSDGGVRTNRHRGAPPPRPCGPSAASSSSNSRSCYAVLYARCTARRRC